MEINWDIVGAEREPSTGKILTLSYLVIGNLDGILKHTYGKVTLDEPTKELIPFEDLDKATLIGWVKTKLGRNKPKKIENDLIASLKEIQATKPSEVKKNGLPW